jgi:hypothetical protein
MNNQRTRTVKSGTTGRLQLSAVLYMCCMARNERYPSIDDSWWPAHKDVGDAVDVRCVYMDDLQCCRIARASQQLARNGTYAKWTRDDGKGYQLNVCVVYSRSLAVCTGSRLLLRAFRFNFPPVTYMTSPHTADGIDCFAWTQQMNQPNGSCWLGYYEAVSGNDTVPFFFSTERC